MERERNNDSYPVWRFPDIVEALRERCARYAGGTIPEGCTCDRCQAADEVAALRAERDELQRRLTAGIEAAELFEAEVERMRPVVERVGVWANNEIDDETLCDTWDAYRAASSEQETSDHAN